MNGKEMVSLLRALADPTRLAILELLMQGAYCNCEIGTEFGLPNNLISHHLKVLREAGLIEASRSASDARWIHYAINKESLGRARALITAFLDPARVMERCPQECRPATSTSVTQQKLTAEFSGVVGGYS
ncbi:MAG: ArsR/SmtB family transcription factor [Anaerolineae bacterium]